MDKLAQLQTLATKYKNNNKAFDEWNEQQHQIKEELRKVFAQYISENNVLNTFTWTVRVPGRIVLNSNPVSNMDFLLDFKKVLTEIDETDFDNGNWFHFQIDEYFFGFDHGVFSVTFDTVEELKQFTSKYNVVFKASSELIADIERRQNKINFLKEVISLEG